MNARATPVRMEEPAPTALMDSHVLALPSGLDHSARINSKVLVGQEDMEGLGR